MTEQQMQDAYTELYKQLLSDLKQAQEVHLFKKHPLANLDEISRVMVKVSSAFIATQIEALALLTQKPKSEVLTILIEQTKASNVFQRKL